VCATFFGGALLVLSLQCVIANDGYGVLSWTTHG
jgi:hypothetical protein